MFILIAGLSYGGSVVYKKNSASKGIRAEIYKNNSIIETISLDEKAPQRTITLNSDDNRYHYTVLVEEGKIRFLTSDCPDKICVKTGWLDAAGETAACLPGKILIKLTGKEE